MRVSTANTYNVGVSSLQERQRKMSDAQEQLTSGKRVQRASDDPTAAARAERALAQVMRTEAEQRALEASRNAMTLTDNAIADATELMQQAREALVAAGNASYSDQERAGVAQQLAGIRAQLLAVANRGDGTGGFLFGGQGATEPPFLDKPDGVSFRGTKGQIGTAGAESLPLTVDGQRTWQQGATGNGQFEARNINSSSAWIDAGKVTDIEAWRAATGWEQGGSGPKASYSVSFGADASGQRTYTIARTDAGGTVPVQSDVPFVSGKDIEVHGMSFVITGAPQVGDRFELGTSRPEQDIFKVLTQAIEQLGQKGRTGPQVAQTVRDALTGVDGSMAGMQSMRASVGETLNRIDMAEGRNAALKFFAQSDRSAAEDLDMVQAISEFQNQQNGYDAALKTYAMVQRMSLFQYLNGG